TGTRTTAVIRVPRKTRSSRIGEPSPGQFCVNFSLIISAPRRRAHRVTDAGSPSMLVRSAHHRPGGADSAEPRWPGRDTSRAWRNAPPYNSELPPRMESKPAVLVRRGRARNALGLRVLDSRSNPGGDVPDTVRQRYMS